MDIRRMKKSEIDQSLDLAQYAFQIHLTEEQRRERRRTIVPQDNWVAVERGKVLSKVAIFPTVVYLGDVKMPMGGISGVATWPEKRRGSLVRSLLKEALVDLRDRGVPISMLYPFSTSFYRKFGWEVFCDTKHWTVTKNELPDTGEPEKGSIRRIYQQDWQILDYIYQKWAKQYAGMIARSEQWWKNRTLQRKKGNAAVYTDANGFDSGYVLYEVKEQQLTVHEFVAWHEDARRELWRFLANHDSMIETAKISPVIDDPSRYLLPEPKIEETRKSYFMARIVDVYPFLHQYPLNLPTEESLVLHVEDDFCDWNNTSWQLYKSKEGRTEIKEVLSNRTGIELSINTLTALVMGYITVREAERTSLVKGNKQQLELLNRALPEFTPFMYDFF
ncbi:GNAT family N-acetyltransferase [Marinococcus luteus]|uniref:GNAT family N-acetyltransferase n=1 Tax=Marinococcus luteus TaxID=1122204 RepID=UPI002ACD1649|nr:GNAT family N-acetyltransferase [Marinococcus luteus]MDZ5781697.1 GNAT family N-acetyltransferase [Marinococcus luteus]